MQIEAPLHPPTYLRVTDADADWLDLWSAFDMRSQTIPKTFPIFTSGPEKIKSDCAIATKFFWC